MDHEPLQYPIFPPKRGTNENIEVSENTFLVDQDYGYITVPRRTALRYSDYKCAKDLESGGIIYLIHDSSLTSIDAEQCRQGREQVTVSPASVAIVHILSGVKIASVSLLFCFLQILIFYCTTEFSNDTFNPIVLYFQTFSCSRLSVSQGQIYRLFTSVFFHETVSYFLAIVGSSIVGFGCFGFQLTKFIIFWSCSSALHRLTLVLEMVTVVTLYYWETMNLSINAWAHCGSTLAGCIAFLIIMPQYLHKKSAVVYRSTGVVFLIFSLLIFIVKLTRMVQHKLIRYMNIVFFLSLSAVLWQSTIYCRTILSKTRSIKITKILAPNEVNNSEKKDGHTLENSNDNLTIIQPEALPTNTLEEQPEEQIEASIETAEDLLNTGLKTKRQAAHATEDVEENIASKPSSSDPGAVDNEATDNAVTEEELYLFDKARDLAHESKRKLIDQLEELKDKEEFACGARERQTLQKKRIKLERELLRSDVIELRAIDEEKYAVKHMENKRNIISHTESNQTITEHPQHIHDENLKVNEDETIPGEETKEHCHEE